MTIKISLTGLQLVLIALKVLEVIDWSWTVVLIPIWISLAIIAIVLLGFITAWIIFDRFDI